MADPLLATLGAAPFTIDDLEALASSAARLALSEEARAAVAASRRVVERYAAGEEPVYGLNTGLGANLDYRVEPAALASFQEQLVRGRAIGAGEPLPERVCRAALIARCIGLARGGAGISPGVLDLLLAMVERGVTPVVPRRGSIGAGDLGLCAHIGLVAVGRGEAWYDGDRLAGDAALAAAGLHPVKLGPKDGHALCSSSAVTTGYAAVTLVDTARLVLFAVYAAALADEGFAANLAIFDSRIASLRGAAREEEAATLFHRLLEGSSLFDGSPRRLQDPLSFRCLAQVVGVVLQALGDARREVELEIAAVGDSPVVLLPHGEMLSTASFHTPAVALAFDSLAIACAHLAGSCFQRICRLMEPELTDLPRYLSPVGGGSAGYVPVQKLAAALLGEIRLLATPASLDAMPVSDAVEDVAPQTPLAISKVADLLEPLRILVAVEALVAAQAVDLRAGARLAPPTRRLHEAVRSVVAPLEADREPAPDVERVVSLAADPSLLEDLAGSLVGLDLPFLPRISAVAGTP